MAMHHAATRALYELNKDLSMHTVLPPLFADAWKSWKAEEKEGQEQKKKKLEDHHHPAAEDEGDS